MPRHNKPVEAGVLGPPELVFLNRVFSEGLFEGETDRQREACASRILAYYTAGITDHMELSTLVKQPLGR